MMLMSYCLARSWQLCQALRQEKILRQLHTRLSPAIPAEDLNRMLQVFGHSGHTNDFNYIFHASHLKYNKLGYYLI